MDFRSIAVEQSEAILASEHVLPLESRKSLCLELDGHGFSKPPFWKTYWLLLAGIAVFMVLPFMVFNEQAAYRWASKIGISKTPLDVTLVTMTFAGLIMMLVGFLAPMRSGMRFKNMGDRPDGLFDHRSALPHFECDLFNALAYKPVPSMQVIGPKPEDRVVVALDADRKRILIEGETHRYLVHAADVVEVVPVSSDHFEVSSRLVYRVGTARLSLLLRQKSVLGMHVVMHSPLFMVYHAIKQRRRIHLANQLIAAINPGSAGEYLVPGAEGKEYKAARSGA
jgi:hypothetical protein